MFEFALIVGAPLLFIVWLAVLVKWRTGLIGLLVFMPFAGIPILLSDHNPLVVLAKDVLWVVPLYLSFFVFHGQQARNMRVSGLLFAALGLFAAVVMLQMLNPRLSSLSVGAIGAKVWLFYIPLLFVGGAAVSSAEDLVRLNRLMLVIAVVPCAVGIVQWMSSLAIGYQATFTAMYGARGGADATQEFSSFNYGGTMFRIPSTFSFSTQYFGFVLAMLVPCYVAMNADPAPRWRRFGRLMLYFVLVASFLSGSRAAFVFSPLMVAAMYLVDGKLTRMMAGLIIVPLLLYLSLDMVGLDPLSVLTKTRGLTSEYGATYVTSPIGALAKFPFGIGTGMSTSAARYAGEASTSLTNLGFNIESYYTKSILELGAFGLIALLALFGAVIVETLRARQIARTPALRSAASAYAAFLIVIVLNSLKGWIIDIDPVNVYFWLFAGLGIKSAYLSEAPARAAAAIRRAGSRYPLARSPLPQRPRY